MFFPYGTDAPLYHRPYATVGLIVLNLALAWFVPKEVVETWALTLGDGLHPLQWLTHGFLHAGLVHAIGSMMFLWVFGLIVEGKVGPFWFVGLYVLVGVLHGAMVQLCALDVRPQITTLGSEASVCGMLGLAVVWSPVNTITTLWVGRGFMRWFAETYEIPVGLFALAEVVWNIVSLVLRHIGGLLFFASALGNLSGMLWGLVLGSIMLRANLVDCEGWDVFRVLSRHLGRIKAERKKTRRRGPRSDILRERFAAKPAKAKRRGGGSPEPSADEPAKLSAVERILAMLDEGLIDEPLKLYVKLAATMPGWPSEPDALAIIKAMHAQSLRVQSIPVMRDFCRNHPDGADRVRLKLAQIHIREREHPTRGLRILSQIAEGALPEPLESLRAALTQQAEAMREEGVLELEGDD